jgi:hypothetical protein
VAFSTFRMEPAFMILGDSVGTWAAMAAKQPAGRTRGVAPAALHTALLMAGQVLAPVPAPVPPSPPPPPPASTGLFRCTDAFKRCVEVPSCKTGCTKDPGCGGDCAALRPAEWLALQGGDGGFALHPSGDGGGGGGGLELTALSAKSFLKKSELHSSTLPAAAKRLVPQGTRVPIQGNEPASQDGYWLVTLM